jgi:hypothetical protein
MGVTREAPTTATGGLVEELKAQGQDKGEDAFDKRPAIVKQLNVGGFILNWLRVLGTAERSQVDQRIRQ